jgi:hypothetical protein
MERNGIQFHGSPANPLVWRWMVRLEGCAKIGTSPNRIGVVQHAPLYLPLAWNLMRVNMRVVPIN